MAAVGRELEINLSGFSRLFGFVVVNPVMKFPSIDVTSLSWLCSKWQLAYGSFEF